MRTLLEPARPATPSTAAMLAIGYAGLALATWAWMAPAFIPRPAQVVAAAVELWRHDGLGPALLASLGTNLQAIACAAAVSLLLGWGSATALGTPLARAAGTCRFLGLTGLALMFTLLTGGGHALKVVTLAFSIAVFLVTALVDVVGETPRAAYDHARTLRMGPWRAFGEVVVLGQSDRALEMIRQSAAVSWMMLTAVEGLVKSQGGVGTLLLNENKHLNLSAVLAIQASLLAVGLLQDAGFVALKRTACPWTLVGRGRP